MRHADDAIVMPAGELATFRRRHERDLSNNLDTNERTSNLCPFYLYQETEGRVSKRECPQWARFFPLPPECTPTMNVRARLSSIR